MFNLEIFKDKQALIAERDSLSAQVKELEPLKQKIAEYEKLVNELPTVKQQFDADLEKIKSEHKAEVEKLQQQITDKAQVVEAVPNLVQLQVEQKLSNIGLTEPVPALTTETVEDIVKQLASADSATKKKIFQQHKELLLKEAGVDLSRW